MLHQRCSIRARPHLLNPSFVPLNLRERLTLIQSRDQQWYSRSKLTNQWKYQPSSNLLCRLSLSLNSNH